MTGAVGINPTKNMKLAGAPVDEKIITPWFLLSNLWVL